MKENHESLEKGIEFFDAGDLERAEEVFRALAERDPDHAVAWHYLGAIAFKQQRLKTAAERIELAIAIQPGYAEAQNTLGLVLQEQGNLEGAILCFRRALEARPDFAAAHYNLGRTFQFDGKWQEAIPSYQRAIELRPSYYEACNNLGVIFQEQERLDEAVFWLQRTLNLKPDYARAYNSLGVALIARGQAEEAAKSFRRAIELQPDLISAHNNYLFTLGFCPSVDAATVAHEHRQFDALHAAPLARFIQPHDNDRSPGRRLRVGYVSPHFFDHCLTLFTLPLLRAHDRQGFEVVCYSDVAHPDSHTQRLREASDLWREIVGLSDERASELIREDRIDILVDLTMHMEGSRLLVLARKPAPVQVCWLAYPGTTGLAAMDYRLTDPCLDPPNVFDDCYTETSVRLPDTFWCYDPLTEQPAVGPPPCLETGVTTFGCLNNFYKVNAKVLGLWGRVLAAVERSRLLLLAPEGSARQWVLESLARHGIAAERVAFVSRQPRGRYLELYHHIDIGLDTVPYNGHTTSLDSYWMGVPVVTLVGQTVVGRAGVSQLTNLGLPELIGQTPDEFVAIAAKLAGNLPWLSHLRQTLRERLQASPLMDAGRFARNMESAYRSMWRHWCAKEV